MPQGSTDRLHRVRALNSTYAWAEHTARVLKGLQVPSISALCFASVEASEKNITTACKTCSHIPVGKQLEVKHEKNQRNTPGKIELSAEMPRTGLKVTGWKDQV